MFPQVKSKSVRVSHRHVRIYYPFPQVKAIRNYVLIAMFPQIMPVRVSHQHARINYLCTQSRQYEIIY